MLTAWAVAGLVLGYLAHPLAQEVRGSAPVVTWAQPLGLLLLAAILGGTAWLTWRTIHVRRERLEPHQAVNRLVLARASAMVGAFVGGGYLGYAVSWLGIDTDLAGQRVARAAIAALAGALITITALLLERACRVPRESDAP